MGQPLQQSGSSSPSPLLSNKKEQHKEKNAQITPAPELRVRQDACSQVSQSASQQIQQASQDASRSIQQATQQAAQSIQQASQQASEASRQASQSASQAIQQAQQTASQSVADASRTASSISSSANSVVSSVQASAESEIARANLAMQTAQLSASLAQSEASKAILAVAGPTAASQVGQGNPITTTSHGGTVNGTQLALAIVGSIIASSLITFLAHLIFLRHKKLSRAAHSKNLEKEGDSSDDLRFPTTGQVTTTIGTSQPAYESERNNRSSSPHVTFSLFPKKSSSDNPTEKQPAPDMKKSETKAEEPPKSPSLRSWLRGQNGISPFGSIQLPTNQGSTGPLGGQLKSPLRGPPPSRFRLDPGSDKAGAASTSQSDPTGRPLVSPKTVDGIFEQSSTNQANRESRASEWTDAITEGSAMTPSSPKAPTRQDSMRIPSPKMPIRNTAEWLMDRATFRSYSPDLNSRNSKMSVDSRGFLKPGFAGGLPSSPRSAGTSRPGRQGSNAFLDPKGKGKARDNGERTQPNTPGVGKAM